MLFFFAFPLNCKLDRSPTYLDLDLFPSGLQRETGGLVSKNGTQQEHFTKCINASLVQLKDRSTKQCVFLTIHASQELDGRWKSHGKPIQRGVDITISHFDNLVPLASTKPACAKAGPIGFKCRGIVWSTLSVGVI